MQGPHRRNPAAIKEGVETIIEQIESLTSKHGSNGRPTGSAECNAVMNLIKEAIEELQLTVHELPDQSGIVASVVNFGNVLCTKTTRGVMTITHVDFHPLQRRRVHLQYESDSVRAPDYTADRCYDNTGGIAIMLRLMMSIRLQETNVQRPLHLAFITGGDAYTEEDAVEDSRRVTGHGLRFLTTFVREETLFALPWSAVTIYASVYEQCQRYMELEDNDKDMSFHSFHVVGAGYALGTLPVTCNPTGSKLTISINKSEPNFDSSFLQAFNQSQSAFPIACNGRFVTYLVPRCQPPLSDSWGFEMQSLGIRVARVDAPLLIADTAANTFAAVQDVILLAVKEFVFVDRSREDIFFETTDDADVCGEEYVSPESGPFNAYDMTGRDVESGVVVSDDHNDNSCSVQ